MRTSLRLSLFAAALVVAFGGALGIGSVSGVQVTPPAQEHEDAGTGGTADAHADDPADEAGGGHADDGGGAHADDGSGGAAHVPGGLQVSDGGYTLGEITAPTAAGEEGRLSFAILGPEGEPVTEFEVEHEKELHLIVLSAGTTEFRHVHPTLAADGTWSLDWAWPAAGTYRVYADFHATGSDGALTLARDVTVPGVVRGETLPAASTTAQTDGYEVALDGDLSTAGGDLTFTITRDGQAVTDLDPYLGAYGHLVAIRVGDLAYLHVHPEGEVGVSPPGPDITFGATAPSPGTYRLFLDFSHGGEVHTADLTVVVGAEAS